jgi:endonuclease YncB( thermonuclease family)
VFEKECHVESLGPDKYNRTIGRVMIDGKDVNAAILGTGMALRAISSLVEYGLPARRSE